MIPMAATPRSPRVVASWSRRSTSCFRGLHCGDDLLVSSISYPELPGRELCPAARWYPFPRHALCLRPLLRFPLLPLVLRMPKDHGICRYVSHLLCGCTGTSVTVRPQLALRRPCIELEAHQAYIDVIDADRGVRIVTLYGCGHFCHQLWNEHCCACAPPEAHRTPCALCSLK